MIDERRCTLHLRTGKISIVKLFKISWSFFRRCIIIVGHTNRAHMLGHVLTCTLRSFQSPNEKE